MIDYTILSALDALAKQYGFSLRRRERGPSDHGLNDRSLRYYLVGAGERVIPIAVGPRSRDATLHELLQWFARHENRELGTAAQRLLDSMLAREYSAEVEQHTRSRSRLRRQPTLLSSREAIVKVRL